METYQPATLKRDLSKGIRCKNTSGEEMPAFSAFMIGSEVSGVVQAIKPNEDSAKQVLFSPAHAVPDNGSFFAMSPYDEYVTYTGSPAIGDELGTASGAWTLSPDQTGFVMLSGSGGVARCRPFKGGGGIGVLILDDPANHSNYTLSGDISENGSLASVWYDFNEAKDIATLTGSDTEQLSISRNSDSNEQVTVSINGVSASAGNWNYAQLDLYIELKDIDGGTWQPLTGGGQGGLRLKAWANFANSYGTQYTNNIYHNYRLPNKKIASFRWVINRANTVLPTGDDVNIIIQMFGGQDYSFTFVGNDTIFGA